MTTAGTAEPVALVALAAGPDLDRTVAAAIASAGGIACGACVLDEVMIVAGPGQARARVRETVAAVAALARLQVPNVQIAFPPAALGVARALRRPGSGPGWVSINVSARTTHFVEILVPRELAAIGSLVAVTSIAGDRRPRPSLAIGLWIAYAHPKQALGARLTGTRHGLAAEIALAFAPRLYVIAGDLGSQIVAVATSDPIAAELVGLALQHERLRLGQATVLDPDLEAPGPWMDPLVQRATELRLGVTTPDRIALATAWAGPAGGDAALTALADRIRLALGLPEPPPESLATGGQ